MIRGPIDRASIFQRATRIRARAGLTSARGRALRLRDFKFTNYPAYVLITVKKKKERGRASKQTEKAASSRVPGPGRGRGRGGGCVGVGGRERDGGGAGAPGQREGAETRRQK
jgi:hypothetical protein